MTWAVPKNSKPLTEQDLAHSAWWWKRTRFRLPRSPIDPNSAERQWWIDGGEQTAFEYELIRRACKTRKLKPFTDLDSWVQNNLRASLCPPRRRFTIIDTSEPISHGWGQPDIDGWRLNLRATDNQLLEHLRISKLPDELEITSFLTGQIELRELHDMLAARKSAAPSKAYFLMKINEQRAAQGITSPHGLQGQRNRSVSWRWIELLDIAAYRIKSKFKATESERQNRSRARRMAARLLPKYLAVLERIENSPRRPKGKCRPMPLLAIEG